MYNALSKEFAIEILLENVATEETEKKVMTYDMTTPIGPVTLNEWTCGRANGNIQNHPKHSKATRSVSKKQFLCRCGVLCLNTNRLLCCS